MHRVIRSVSVAFVIVAAAMPSVAAPRGVGSKQPASVSAADTVGARETAFVARQQKVWDRLSASICAGCITSANRVVPSNYDRPGSRPVETAKIETVRSAVRTAATPRKFVQLKKRYAKFHRRDRLRLAARARLRAAVLDKRRALRLAALRRPNRLPVRASFIPAYEMGAVKAVYRIPTDQPLTPRDDGRWRESILPAALRMRRG